MVQKLLIELYGLGVFN